MACGFCATGQAGFDRHLTTGEIVEQVVRAARRARAAAAASPTSCSWAWASRSPTTTAVWAAVERLHGDLGLSARHLTVSTVGIVPGIRRLAGEALPVNLAVSLHAANDALRDELVPINRRYPLDDAASTRAPSYLAAKGRRLSFEWALIDGVNDRASRRRELAALCRRLRSGAHVNLIPLNPTPGYADARDAAGRRARVPRPARRRSASTPPCAATAAPTSTPRAASCAATTPVAIRRPAGALTNLVRRAGGDPPPRSHRLPPRRPGHPRRRVAARDRR